MTTRLEQRKQDLTEQIAAATAALASLQQQLDSADAELQQLNAEKPKYEALLTASAALKSLQDQGAGDLFWGDRFAADGQTVVNQAVERAESFKQKIEAAQQSRDSAYTACESKKDDIFELQYHLTSVAQAVEDARFEFVVEREMKPRGYQPAVLPWAGNDDDRRRLRKVILISLLFMFVIGTVPQIWTFPEPDPNKKVEVPDRLVQMLKKKQPPKPIEKPQPVKQEEQKKEVAKKEDRPKPTKEQVQKARETAQTKGVLAFKDSFSDLIDDADVSNLGADAQVTNAGSRSLGGAPGSRSMLAAEATGGSGGIANANISRGGVGAGGSGISGVETGRVESSISAAARDAARPVSDGVGPARTDEEIQIVFDRYKAALYRIYNRELRNDPTLRGKMVLAITIEPDGSVSACKVQSSDMNSPALSEQIVARVKLFNFGAKEGVPSTKILYPIDFLPAG